MNTFVKLTPMKPGETLKDKAEEFMRGCRSSAGTYVQPCMVEASCFKAYPVTNTLSVIYLRTEPTVGMVEKVVSGASFGINMQCVFMGVGAKQCFVMPIRKDTGKSLIGKCACLECIRVVAREAERTGEDIVKRVWKVMACPVMIISTTLDSEWT